MNETPGTGPGGERDGERGGDDGFEAARARILGAQLGHAAFEGWTLPALRKAAAEAGESRASLAAAFPNGVGDALAYWTVTLDEAMAAAMAGPAFEPLRIREKVAFAIRFRLDRLRSHKEAARRAAATLALPVNAPLAARLAWGTADAVWRGLGDKSTDFNFYSKRGILTGVWTSTLARWLSDDSADEAATNAFLNARIDNIMQFEKLKKRVRGAGFDPEDVFGWLAKRRYRESAPARAHEDAKIDEALDESFPASDPPYFAGGGGRA